MERILQRIRENKRLLVFVLLGLIILAAGVALARQRPTIVGFCVNQPGPTDSVPSLKAHGKLLDEISPLWYSIMPDGSLDVKVNRDALAIARKYDLRVLPLINVGKNDDTFLRNPTVRDKVIQNIAAVVKKNDYEGINLDVQLLPTDEGKNFAYDRDLLTDFVRRLRDTLKPMHKTLAISVIPKVQVPFEIDNIYDYGELAKLIDKVALMTYDRHQTASPPGPVAPFSWVEANIKEAMKLGFQNDQILLGVATYGYDWPTEESGGFSRPTKEIMNHAARIGVEIKWNDRYMEPYYVYTAPNGRQREIWFENKYTLQQKIRLMEKYRLAGIAIWRLGYEEDHFWDTLRENFPGKQGVR